MPSDGSLLRVTIAQLTQRLLWRSRVELVSAVEDTRRAIAEGQGVRDRTFAQDTVDGWFEGGAPGPRAASRRQARIDDKRVTREAVLEVARQWGATQDECLLLGELWALLDERRPGHDGDAEDRRVRELLGSSSSVTVLEQSNDARHDPDAESPDTSLAAQESTESGTISQTDVEGPATTSAQRRPPMGRMPSAWIWLLFGVCTAVVIVIATLSGDDRTGDQTSEQRSGAPTGSISPSQPSACSGVTELVPDDREDEVFDQVPSRIEASVAVANYSCGDTRWSNAVGASYDQVVRVKLWYGYYGDLPRADDLTMTVSRSVDENRHTLGVGFSSDSIAGPAALASADVFLDRSDAALELIPGSVQWNHNTRGPDDPADYVIDEWPDLQFGEPTRVTNVRRGPGGEGSLYAMFRVVVQSMTVEVQFDGERTSGRPVLELAPEGVARSHLVVRNRGNTSLPQVQVAVDPDSGVRVGSGTATILSHNGAVKRSVTTDALDTGLVCGDLEPGDSCDLRFQIEIQPDVVPWSRLAVRFAVTAIGEKEANYESWIQVTPQTG